jgi:streptogramin lyase
MARRLAPARAPSFCLLLAAAGLLAAAEDGGSIDTLAAGIDQPFGVELGPGGALYVCEVGRHRVLRLDLATKEITAAAGNGTKGHSGDGGPATAASLDEPYEVRFDEAGDMYFVEMAGAVIRKVEMKTGTIRTIAGSARAGFSGDGGPAVEARLRSPHSIAFDGRGGLLVADIGNHRIRRVDLESGRIDTIAGDGRPELPRDGALAASQPLKGPRALAVTGKHLWIALREGNSIWSMELETGRLRHVAGTGKVGFEDGPGREASFNGPKGIAAGADGALFVVDTENQAIRRIAPLTFAVTTVAGSGPRGRGFGGDGGPALAARLDRPHGIAVDARGVIYIGDSNNHRVRRVLR